MKGRYEWYPAWLEKKRKYAYSEEKQMNADKFYAVCAGTGLPAIYQRSTFNFKDVNDGANRFLGHSPSGEKPFARIYTRIGNPTTEYLEKVIFKLECDHIIQNSLEADESEPTIGTFVFGSGMAAISAVLMSVLHSGDGIIVGNVYGSTDSLLRMLASRFNIDVHFVSDSDFDTVQQIISDNDNIVAIYIETPTNPTLDLWDIEKASKIAERDELLLIVDNTFCSPYLQQPFRLGADIVIHSMTKFINGHSTTLAGIALGPWEFFSTDVFVAYKDLGGTASPFDSWLNSLGVQDLGLRQEAQSKTAIKLAEFLENHPLISKVTYPGLKSHPDYDICKKQMRNGGSLITFEVKGGYNASINLMNYFARHDTPMELAVSLGSVISYIEHPASMTHGSVPEDERLSRGITDSLVRLSVGAEGYSILRDALDEGLHLATK